MEWKEFFKPVTSKAIIFVLLLAIFGVPSVVKQCATFDFGTGKFPCGPARLTLHNPLFKAQMLDATNIYNHNFLLIGIYLFVLYSLLSLIYFFSGENKMQRIVYTASFIIMFIILRIWMSIR